jgi:hypothetical protein
MDGGAQLALVGAVMLLIQAAVDRLRHDPPGIDGAGAEGLEPPGSQDLDDRFRAAIDYLFTFTLWQPPPGPPSGRRWHNTPQSPK